MTPEAGFGFVVTQDFGIDQFTFSKIPLSDLELLYGLKVKELSIYRSLEHHAALHVEQGSIVLMEADAFYLPDTAAITYRQGHRKTTIAVDVIDAELRRCSYFHNSAYRTLSGEDYLGVFRLLPHLQIQDDVLPPYVEVVERSIAWQRPNSLQSAAFILLRSHLTHRPARNPFTAWRQAFGEHVDMLLSSPALFHDYAFHFPRLAGSSFEMLASHLEWLAPDELQGVAARCGRIAQTAKVIQFRLARAIARRRADLVVDCFESLEQDYAMIMQGLGQYVS